MQPMQRYKLSMKEYHVIGIPLCGRRFRVHNFLISTNDKHNKPLSFDEVEDSINQLLVMAEFNRDKKFYVDKNDSGLARYGDPIVKQWFRKATTNIVLPPEWRTTKKHTPKEIDKMVMELPF